MKRVIGIAGAAFLAAALAACGGGGSSPVPTPVQTSTPKPPTTYTVRVKFSGGASLATVQSALRQSQSRSNTVYLHPLDTTSSSGQLPIIMSVQAPAGSYFAQDAAQSGGVATIQVSPQPSAEPTVSVAVAGVTVDANPITTPTPSPGVTSSPAPPQYAVNATSSTVPSAGTFTANLTGSVTATQPVPLYAVQRGNAACGDTQLWGSDRQVHASDQWGGVTFSNGQVQQATATSSADLYIDGSWCTAIGFQNSADTDTTLYAPYGAILVSSTATPYASITASQWTNSFTSITMAALVQGAVDPITPKDILLIKTADGHIVKLALNEESAGTPPSNGVNGNPAVLNFSYEEQGFSQDGF